MKITSKIAFGALLLGTAAFFGSCNDDEDPIYPMPNAEAPSIYARLGGTTMVADPNNQGQMIEQGRLSYRSVVDSTITLIVADIVAGSDGNLGAHFAPLVGEVLGGNTTNVAELSDNLTDFFSFNTGGQASPINAYNGMNMVATHDPAVNSRMGKKVNDTEFNKFEGYVGAAANLNGVAANTQLYADVVTVLESLRAPIVQE